MKSKILTRPRLERLLIFSSFIILFGCSNRLFSQKSTSEYFVDFQEGFKRELVLIKIDSTVVFKDTITTDESMGFAESFIIKNLLHGQKIQVIANKDSLIITPTKKYIGISKFPSGKLVYRERDNGFQYD